MPRRILTIVRSTRSQRRRPHPFWAMGDIVLHMLQFLSLVHLIRFSHIDKLCQYYAKSFLKGRITRYTSPFFTKNAPAIPRLSGRITLFQRFFQVLEDTKSWIVGSVPLAAASVLSDPPCPTNLNIITHCRQLGTWWRFLRHESGFIVTKTFWSNGAYARAGGLAFVLEHPGIRTYTVSITTTPVANLGALFFAAPNTDQLVAIAAYELITPVLKNVSEQQHIMGWRPGMHRHPDIEAPVLHSTYRKEARFKGATTLDASTANWARPCGLSCPGVWRTAHGLDGIAQLKWGGLDDLDEYTDPTLLELGSSRVMYRFGVRCDNPLCKNSKNYKEPSSA